MINDYVPPSFDSTGFNCPHCSAYAHQKHLGTLTALFFEKQVKMDDLEAKICGRCGQYSLWVVTKLIYPAISEAPSPNPDMPKDVMEDYKEAASILHKSPRGAAALLRLAIQKLCIHLGQKQEKLDHAIAGLVKAGLPVTIQQALDVVRVVGNNAVHPGQIDLRDDHDTTVKLFRLVNIIVENRISEPNEISQLYANKVTESEKEHITKRDSSQS